MWAEARAAAHAEVKRCQDAMEATLKVLDATLQVAALPKLDKTRESAAKEEVSLIIGASPEPALTILELAQRDDDIAAVVTNGTWPESLLRSKGIGVQQAKDAAQQARRVAAAAAATSADPVRRAVGEAIKTLGPALGGGGATYTLTRFALEHADDEAAALGGLVSGDGAGAQSNGNGDGS